jgi:hypothetical protein
MKTQYAFAALLVNVLLTGIFSTFNLPALGFTFAVISFLFFSVILYNLICVA